MGILANTVSICQFRVAGELPAGDLYQWASECLSRHGFRPIDQTPQELSVGWVHLDDNRESGFASPRAFWRDHYLVFTLRRDQRKLPAAILKAYLRMAEDDFLAANPGLHRVPKQKREDLREAVRGALLARTLPVPAVFDAVWDTRSGLVTFTSLGTSNVELFEAQFKKTFEGVRLVALHPFARAESVTSGDLKPLLARANRAGSDALLDLIRGNRWLGWDFLLWLMYQTMNEVSEYRVCHPGPALAGEPFVAYLNDRLVLASEGEGGTQKITVAGPQDRFSEVRAALRSSKQIIEATIHLEQEENLWKMTLKGELFQFGAFRCPAVRIEKDDRTDELNEREAVFYERMLLLEKGLQLFDSLFATFLAERLDSGWEEKLRRIGEWLGEAAP